MAASGIFHKKLFALLFLVSIFSLNGCAENSINNAVLSGPWLISIFTNDVGKMQTVMYFDVEKEENAKKYLFHAYTEKNMDRKIFGFWKAGAGRVMGSNFKNGSLIRITKGQFFSNDSISGVLATPFGNYYLSAAILNGALTGYLSNGHHVVIGNMEGKKGLPALPLHNYTAVMDSAIAVTRNKLYDPAILHSKGWGDFAQEMKRISSITTDDAAFIMAFFYYSHKYLPFSHYTLFHPLEAEDKKGFATEKCVELEQKDAKTMYMKINSFSGSAAEMDSAFSIITNNGYSHLVVDLRDNPGGSIEAGMAFARHLATDTLYGGIFLTQKYFANHTTLPDPKTYNQYLHFSEANYDLLVNGISEYDGICLVVVPQEPVFKGKIDILINGQTASTCEPIIYSMKQYHLATLTGERSAGAMLNGEFFPVMDGFKLFLPTAIYYTADGFKIDKNGVEPDVKVKSADALNVVLQKGK